MISINLYEIIMNMVNFLILLLLLNKFLIKPLSEFVEKRSSGIQSDLELAKNTKAASNALIDEQKVVIQQAMLEAIAIREKAEEIASKEGAKIIATANKNADQLIENAKSEMETAVENAKKDLSKSVGDLAVQLTEIILKRELDGKSKDAIVADGLNKLKVS